MTSSRNLTPFVKALTCSVLLSATPAFAATEILDDNGYHSGPTAGSIVLDAAVGKPLQGVIAAAGTITWLATLPLSLISNSHEEAGRELVAKPLDQFFNRCLGCTPQQDATKDMRDRARVITYDPESGHYPESHYNSDSAPRVIYHPPQ